MHVLLTNDDGPLDDKTCPYMKFFVDEILRSTDWTVSIVVPDQQRSWIGKAHFAGRELFTTYLYTTDSTISENSNINGFKGPFAAPDPELALNHQEWCLVNSTPAACVDVGMHHLKKGDGDIDLVISGPNFGKNSGNLYILASGTVGAAMEAVTHGVKSIALSYEFRSLEHDFHLIKEASRISLEVIKYLYPKLQTSNDIDLFSINVPLVSSLKLGETKIHYAPVLKNQWGSIYESLGAGKFQWAPKFNEVWKDGLKDYTHSDSRVLLNDGVSVTPLRASFNSVDPLEGEIILPGILAKNSSNVLLLSIPNTEYVFGPVSKAFERLGFQVETSLDKLGDLIRLGRTVFHYGEYEDLDLDVLQAHPDLYFVLSYIYRKALIRKHYLANTIHHFVAKNPQSVLKTSFPQSYQLEIDYAEFLDDALDEAYELRDEVESGEHTWILKPSMSDKGQGIRIFRTIDELQAIFNSFEKDEDDEIENAEKQEDDANGVIISQLRHFVVQEYQDHPLLLKSYQGRKFHLRTYVVCIGRLQVFVYKNILTLFAQESFPPELSGDYLENLSGHLTNTCLQEKETALVAPWWQIEGLQDLEKEKIFEDIKTITGDLFKAAASVDRINFQPLDNAIEIFGLDFLVNEDLGVKLLEVNSYPDFKQTGGELKGLITRLFELVAEKVDRLLGNVSKEGSSSKVLELVYSM